MQDQLSKILEHVNYWLSFAEAKNAGIMVLNFTMIIAATGFLNSNLPTVLFIYIGLLITFNLISLFFSIWSMLPNTKNLKEELCYNSQQDISHTNLLFFKDIAKYTTANQYLSEIYLNYSNTRLNIEDVNKQELHLAEEILVNAKIATRKYAKFQSSVYCTLCSIFTPLVLVVLYIVRRKNG